MDFGGSWEEMVRDATEAFRAKTTVGLGRSFAWNHWARLNGVVGDDFTVIRGQRRHHPARPAAAGRRQRTGRAPASPASAGEREVRPSMNPPSTNLLIRQLACSASAGIDAGVPIGQPANPSTLTRCTVVPHRGGRRQALRPDAPLLGTHPAAWFVLACS